MKDMSFTCQEDITSLPFPLRKAEITFMATNTHATQQAVLIERLAALIHQTPGVTARSLSKAIGANVTYVSQVLAGKGGMPSAQKLQAIATHLGTTADQLLGTSEIVKSHSAPTVTDRRPDWRGMPPMSPGIPLVGTGDCADLEVVTEDGDTAEVERSTFDPEHRISYVHRPDALLNNREAYAIYYQGSSMEPRFFAGEIGLVDPVRPAAPGDYVLVQLSDGNSDEVTCALVKRLVRSSSREVVLTQHNPEMTFSVARTHVVRMHRIMSTNDYLHR